MIARDRKEGCGFRDRKDARKAVERPKSDRLAVGINGGEVRQHAVIGSDGTGAPVNKETAANDLPGWNRAAGTAQRADAIEPDLPAG